MTQTENQAVAYSVQEGVATLMMQSAPVNALSRALRVGLIDGIEQALNDDSVSAIVISSSLPIFQAGPISVNSLAVIYRPCSPKC